MPQYNMSMIKGDTFTRTFRWEDSAFIHKDITAITQAAPAQITAVGHGVPNGWRVAVTDVPGSSMFQINAENNPPRSDADFQRATFVDVDNISLNKVSSKLFNLYTSGGVLWYHQPKDLTSYTARLTIWDKRGASQTQLLQLVSPTGIVINGTDYTITATIDSDVVEAATWKKGVYDLEMVLPGSPDIVDTISYGTVQIVDK